MFSTFFMSATAFFESCSVILIGDGLVPIVVAGASVRSSAVCLIDCPLSAWPRCSTAGGPFGLFDGICRACVVNCFGGVVGVCFPILPRSTSFFFFICSKFELGVVVFFVDPGYGCDSLAS
jgi:hypothetical protein